MVHEKRFKEVSTQDGVHPKKRPDGPYDENILCAKCDGIIGIYDGYAKNLLIDNLAQYRNPKNPFYLIPKGDIDYLKLKKFFISLIWRASISNSSLFEQVSLGPYNATALACLKDESSLNDDIFAVLIWKDSPEVKYRDVISFVRTSLAKKTAYKLHFSGYQITVVPKASDMVWNINDEQYSPAVYFLKKDQDLILFELPQDISGKDRLLQSLHSKLKKT